MNAMTTLTSKMQITIPTSMAKKLGLKKGNKLIVSHESNKLVLTPVQHLLQQVAGSLKKYQKPTQKPIDTIIEEAKEKYFRTTETQ